MEDQIFKHLKLILLCIFDEIMQSDAIFKEFVVISQSIYVGKVFY